MTKHAYQDLDVTHYPVIYIFCCRVIPVLRLSSLVNKTWFPPIACKHDHTPKWPVGPRHARGIPSVVYTTTGSGITKRKFTIRGTLAMVTINRTSAIHKSVRETYSDDGIWVRMDAVNDEFQYWLGELENLNRCMRLIPYSLKHVPCSGKHDVVVLRWYQVQSRRLRRSGHEICVRQPLRGATGLKLQRLNFSIEGETERAVRVDILAKALFIQQKPSARFDIIETLVLPMVWRLLGGSRTMCQLRFYCELGQLRRWLRGNWCFFRSPGPLQRFSGLLPNLHAAPALNHSLST